MKVIGKRSGEKSVFKDDVVMTEVIEDNNKIPGLAISGVFQFLDIATETDLLEEVNCLGETIGSVSGAKPVANKNTSKTAENVYSVEVHNTWDETVARKTKPLVYTSWEHALG